MKNLLSFLLLVFTCLLCGCKEEAEDKTLTVATSADYPPFEFYQNEEIVGFDIEVAEIIAERLGYELKIVDMDFIGIIPGLQSGRVDFAVSALNPTAKRAQNVDFSDIYYGNDASFVYIEDGINDDLLNFRNKIFGVQQGSVFEDFLLQRQREFPSIKIQSVAKLPLLVQDLKVGRIDAILLDHEIGHEVLRKVPNTKILSVNGFNFGTAIAFPKGSKMREKFNAVLRDLEHEGILDDLKKKWFVHMEDEDLIDAIEQSAPDGETVEE